jgi:hypothetical protein
MTFARLISGRLMLHFSKIICPEQLDFIPGRFIIEHGIIVQTIKMLANQQNFDSIGLLLAQEKHMTEFTPTYFSAIMTRFGLHDTI